MPTKKAPPEGIWQLESYCGGGCGSGQATTKRVEAKAPPPTVTGAKCRSVFMGRAGNRCGWPITWLWVYRPKEPF